MNVNEPDEELRVKLADVDVPTFKQVIERSVKHIQAEYGKGK